MRTKLIAFVVAISITLGIGWYVVAQETFPFAPLPLFSPNTVLTSNQLNEIVKHINAIIEFITQNRHLAALRQTIRQLCGLLPVASSHYAPLDL